jgi:hypothetical protein
MVTTGIGVALRMSKFPVQHHSKSMFDKVGVSSRRELVAKLFDRLHRQGDLVRWNAVQGAHQERDCVGHADARRIIKHHCTALRARMAAKANHVGTGAVPTPDPRRSQCATDGDLQTVFSQRSILIVEQQAV